MQDKVKSILSKYAGQNVEFALSFDIGGKTLVDHLSDLIQSEKELSKKEGKVEGLNYSRDICHKAEDREKILRMIETLQ